ncbi:hypothetical protein D3C74_496940 [compost metagenome]
MSIFNDFERIEEFKDIKFIILELNTKIEDADTLLMWEQKLDKKFIVTIQDNETDRILTVDMHLPYKES